MSLGSTYDIDFWLYNFGGTPSAYSFEFGGSTLSTVLNPSAFGYTHYSFSAVASLNGIVDLRFQQTPSYFLLDDVSVVRSATASVPDGGTTVALLGVVLSSMVWVRRKLA